MNKKIFPGQTVRVRGSFRDIGLGTFFDPPTVTLTFKKPDGEEVVVEVEREAQGKYTGTILVDSAGDWYWRMASEETAAKEGSFHVDQSKF